MQWKNEDIDRFARELPSLTLHGNISTATTMAFAARIVELLDERSKVHKRLQELQLLRDFFVEKAVVRDHERGLIRLPLG